MNLTGTTVEDRIEDEVVNGLTATSKIVRDWSMQNNLVINFVRDIEENKNYMCGDSVDSTISEAVSFEAKP